MDTANALQAERWNGDSGRHWIANRERHAAIRQRLTPRLLDAAGLAAGDRVLDVGCGCGETSVAVARAVAGADGTVLGLDLSGQMLDVARRLAAGAGLANARFVEGDAQVHPLPPRFFDVALSSFGVMFFDDPAAAFANILGALRPGGRLAFLCWQRDRDNELFGIPEQAFLAHAPAPESAGADLFADRRWIAALLAGVGCLDIHIESVREPARVGSDVADVVDYFSSMGRFRRLFAELGDGALTGRILATMAERYAARQRPDGVWVEAAAWLVRARLTGR